MFFSRTALLTIVSGSPLQHGFVVGMLLGLFLIALLYISRYVLSPHQKKVLAAKSKVVPNFLPPDYFPPIQFCNGSKNLGIFDSIITFSQYGPNDLEFTDYDCMAQTYSSPKFSTIIDVRLISSLKQTGQVIRSLNDHLHMFGINGFNAMLVFVFQVIELIPYLSEPARNIKLPHCLVLEIPDFVSCPCEHSIKNSEGIPNPYSSTEALLHGTTNETRTPTRNQRNLTALTQMIEVTSLLTDSALGHHDELIKSFNQSIEKIKQTGTEASQQQQCLLAQLQQSVDLAFVVQSGLERWRRQLKLYGINVRSTQAPTRKKGRLSNPSADYHCKSESQDLDMQAQNARHEFNLGRFKVALKAFRCIYQTICHNSSHDSPRRHSFFLHIRLDVSQCHLALLQGPEALKVLSPCYQWGHQTSISWSNPLWSEVSSLIASSQMLIRQEEQIKTMLENQQWKEVNEGISEVVSATEYMSQYLSCTK
ncbi:hypothetical protein PGT21_022597 [Puccinia graminis f. sp. tritici]|uniref:Uncharacterized protein n=1 Tax=Puccinia graminis f. sp. tritici TaxID=56615 RepID=A0A5B0NLR5_PUCGR|nr:hypothetical protein PGT21_022597 [Puccinia graminis f. sp. tritici]